MQNISFSLTTPQFLDGSKDVTRRLGWWKLKPGTTLRAVKQRMGLKKGEKVQGLGLIEVVNVSNEPLDHISHRDVIREGFPGWTPEQFVEFFCKTSRCKPWVHVRRIEFRRLDDE